MRMWGWLNWSDKFSITHLFGDFLCPNRRQRSLSGPFIVCSQYIMVFYFFGFRQNDLVGGANSMSGRSRRKAHALLADVPVVRPGDDQLGRVPFAHTLANTIKSMRGTDPFVFGLCGPWGSGKSSILNLVERELHAGRGKKKSIVFKFNPWWFSGQDQLLRAFLSQMGTFIGRIDTGKRVSKLGEKLSLFGKVLRPLGWIPGAGVVKEVAEVLEAGAEGSKKLGEELTQDVAGIRKEIDELLKASEQRIVIVMDDIDRLTAPEIAQLFLIVKAVADFPNTVYLLAFDHAIVCKAITSTLGLDGAAYLEKIVQVQIDIPPCGPVLLQQLFMVQLQHVLDEKAITEKSKQDFGNLFHDGLKEFFQTPRSVKRLTNVLRVLLPAVQGEVHWPDFVAITSLMVFAPEAYRFIRDSPEEFMGFEGRREQRGDDAKKFYESWLEQLPANQRSLIRQIVQRLFPKVETALGGPGYGGGFLSRWRTDLRVCSPECFDRYFKLRVPEGDLSESDWRNVILLMDSPVKLDQLISRYCQESGSQGLSSRAKAFIERASLFATHQATASQAKALFRAIARVGDLIISRKDTDRSNLIPIDNELRLIWLMQHCLRPIDDLAERERLIESCLVNEAGLRTAVRFLRFFGAEHGKYGQDRQEQSTAPHLSLDCVNRIEAALLVRIRAAAADGSLEKDPEYTRTLFHWQQFGGTEEAKSWIQKVAATDVGFVRLIEQLKGFGTIHGMGDRVAAQVPTFSSEPLIGWLGGIESRLRAERLLSSPPSWLTAEQKETLQLVLRSIKPVDLMQIDRGRRAAGSATLESTDVNDQQQQPEQDIDDTP